MSGPRNRSAYERGQLIRSAIRGMLESRSQLDPPLVAKEIQARLLCLGHKLEVRQVQWHVQQIRRASRSSSTPPVAA